MKSSEVFLYYLDRLLNDIENFTLRRNTLLTRPIGFCVVQ